MPIINGTITTGGTSQTAVQGGNNFAKCVLQSADSDIRFNTGTAAAGAAAGELVPPGQSATIILLGDQLNVWSATTGAAYSVRSSL